MRIGVAGSMHYVEKMLEIRDQLIALGHDAFTSSLTDTLIGKSDEEKEQIKNEQKQTKDAIRLFWDDMQDADALLVVNLERHGIPNYIGGSVFLEMGFAFVLKQKIFLLNPIPDIKIYKSEIEVMKPIIIYGELSLVQ